MPLMILAHDALIKAVLWLREVWRTPRGPMLIGVALIVMLIFCIWLGKFASFGHHEVNTGDKVGYPHQSAELIRILIAFSLAWLMSRYAEWDAATSRRTAAGALGFVLIVGVVSSLAITGDLGPVLAMLLGALPLLFAMLMPKHSDSHPAARILIAIVGLLGLLLLIQTILMIWLPESSLSPLRLFERAYAALNPFDARLDYAAQIAWLLDAATRQGFGLTAVPWCGAMPLLGLSDCTKSSGVPVQFGSDYVFVGLAALWGREVTAGISALTAVMFVALAFVSLPGRGLQSVAFKAPALLHAWIVVAFSSLALGQLAVSIAGNAGAIQLSGITQPLLGLGTVSLLAMAAWIGFAMGGKTHPYPTEAVENTVVPRSWVSRSVMSMTLGALVLMSGLIFWVVRDETPVNDQLISRQVEQGLAIIACHQDSDKHLKTAACTKLQKQWPIVTEEKISGRCEKLFEQLPLTISKISKYTTSPLNLPAHPGCAEVDALNAVSSWVKDQGNQGGRNLTVLLNTPAYMQGEKLAVINPYRVPGCLKFAHSNSIYLGDEVDQLLCGTDGVSRLGKLVPDIMMLDQILGRATRAVRKSTDRGQSEYLVQQAESQGEITQPDWLKHLGLDVTLPDWFQVQTALASTLRSTTPRTTTLGQGHHLELSIIPDTQIATQNLADCYTGNSPSAACDSGGADMLEHARARMMGILVMDVKTGEIQAAASAHTPCYAAQHNGEVRGDCLRLPEAPLLRDWKLTNHPFESVAMLGSTDKMAIALGLIQVGSPLGRNPAQLDQVIAQSQTERIIDDVMCLEQNFNPACIKSRLLAISSAAERIGWQTHCKEGDPQCGKINLLHGSSANLNYAVPAAHWMTDPKRVLQSLAVSVKPGERGFTREAVAACYKHGDKYRWRNCKGEALVQVVAELFGQGNATSSPVGIAQGLLNIVRYAQAQSAITPTLLHGEIPQQVASSHADSAAVALLHAMGNSILPEGTANSACLRVEAILNRQTPGNKPFIDCHHPGNWVVSGKTGTPLFPHDKYTYLQRENYCQKVARQPDSQGKRYEEVRCMVSPVKWYASAVGQRRSDGRIEFKKIIIVLAERNWNARTGQIDSPYDKGSPNVAAEVALLTANRLIASENPVN